MGFVRILALSLCVLIPLPAAAVSCTQTPQTCPSGQSQYYAPTGSTLCPAAGFYCSSPSSVVNGAPASGVGARSNVIRGFQQRLIALGYLPADNATGYFGPLTRAAVERFQCERGIVCEGTPAATGYGSIGPRTATALAERSEAVSTEAPAQPPANTDLIAILRAKVAELQQQLALLILQKTRPTVAPDPSYTYEWRPAGWGACTGGTQARIIFCMRSDNATASEASCTQMKPATSQSCSNPVPDSTTCTFNGTAIAHGATVTAYQAASVVAGQTCASQVRTCSNGVLSGTYASSTCVVASGANCSLNGLTIPHGTATTTYQSATVPFGSTCISQQRVCANGALSGDHAFVSCTVAAPTPGDPCGTLQGSRRSYCELHLTAHPTEVPEGQSTFITWQALNVKSCEVYSVQNGKRVLSSNKSSGKRPTIILSEMTLELECTALDNALVRRTLSIKTIPTGTVKSNSATPSAVNWGALRQDLDGFAHNATGGLGGELCVVTNVQDYTINETPIVGSLRECIERRSKEKNWKPLWIYFDPVLKGTPQKIILKRQIRIEDDTTIDGRGVDVTISHAIDWSIFEINAGRAFYACKMKAGYHIGDLPTIIRIVGRHNIILTHLKFSRENYESPFPDDSNLHKECLEDIIGVTDLLSRGPTTNIWLNHLSFEKCGDGCIDAVFPKGTDQYFTISNSLFKNVDKAMAFGDRKGFCGTVGCDRPLLPNGVWPYKVSMYGNKFENCNQDCPRHGAALMHVYNNFYDGWSQSTIVTQVANSKSFFENNLLSPANMLSLCQNCVLPYTYRNQDTSGKMTLTSDVNYLSEREKVVPLPYFVTLGSKLTPRSFDRAGWTIADGPIGR